MDILFNIILYLAIYSFLGWCCECIYCSVGNGKLINRGFLYGPFCPIYGFGALAIIYFLQFVPQHVTYIFLGGMVITSTLEYITSWAMEKIFRTSWWDYSEKRFNLNGRICLLNSTLFGILCLVLSYDLHPKVSSIFEPWSIDFKAGFIFAFLIYFAGDLTATLYSVLGINIRLDKLEKIKTDIESRHAELGERLDLLEFSFKLKEMEIRDDMSETFQNLLEKNTMYQRRLFSAFPQMRNRKYPQYVELLKKHIDEKIENMKNDI